MNFGYLSNIFAYLESRSEPSINEEDKSKLKKSAVINLFKALLSLLFAILCSYTLIKVYEVPVYYTNIDVVSRNSTNNEKFDIRIIRNYDRSDKNTSLPDTFKYFPDLNHNMSGIYVNGSFKSNPNCGLHGMEYGKLDSLQKVCVEERKKHTQTSLEKPIFVYFSILSSERQMIGRKNWGKRKVHYYNDGYLESHFFDGEKEKETHEHLKDYFEMSYFSNPKVGGGNLYENYYYASSDNSPLSVSIGIETPALRRPPVFRTLEDVSKLVEVIELGQRLGNPNNEVMWRITNSLKIDYVGPSEFSSHITPKPDSITQNYILYTDWNKIMEIGRHGLRYHVTFPDMENIQEARIFILSGLVTGLFALFFRYLYRFIRDIYKNCKIKRIWIIIGLTIVVALAFLLLWLIFQQEVNPFSLRNEAFK